MGTQNFHEFGLISISFVEDEFFTLTRSFLIKTLLEAINLTARGYILCSAIRIRLANVAGVSF